LPPVARTDAVEFFDRWLQRSPRLNRVGMRACLYLAEAGPLAFGFRGRLRALAPADRLAYLERLDRGALRQLSKLLRGIAQLSYYGDDAIMRTLGYDPDANVARGRALRAAEGRW
jgi:hypothetical protein